MIYQGPTGRLTAFRFSPFDVRNDSNPSGDGLSHLSRINWKGCYRFLGLGLKTEDGVRRDRAAHRTRGVITEVASRRSGVAIPSLPSDERWKEMDKIAPAWVKWL